MDDQKRFDILRRQVNDIDDELVRLLDERFSICTEIGRVKKRMGLEAYDSVREAAIIKRLSDLEIHSGMAKTIWPVIMDYSKTLQ